MRIMPVAFWIPVSTKVIYPRQEIEDIYVRLACLG